MGGGYVANAGVYLVNFVFGLYILAVLLRFLLQMVRADFYNPICQAIVRVTNPPIRPMRRYIPSFSGIDTSSLLLLVVLQLLNTWLVMTIVGADPALAGLLVLAVAELITKVVWTFMIAIFIHIIVSWVAQGVYNPVSGLIDALRSPLLGRARRVVPAFGGVGLSPMLPIVLLQLSLLLIVAPLRDFGFSLL